MNKIILLILSLSLVSCTRQCRARNYGGTDEITLPPAEKLINVTWHDDDIWYLTRPMHKGDSVITYDMMESSSYGIWNGHVIIHEQP